MSSAISTFLYWVKYYFIQIPNLVIMAACQNKQRCGKGTNETCFFASCPEISQNHKNWVCNIKDTCIIVFCLKLHVLNCY